MKVELMENLEIRGIPEHMRDGIVRYIENGIEPGSFLTAVICNDLTQACACADSQNRRLLFEYIDFFYNYAPRSCWGSREKFDSWIILKSFHAADALDIAPCDREDDL